jgi:predicted DNA-binding transcriptional regulator AlpA
MQNSYSTPVNNYVLTTRQAAAHVGLSPSQMAKLRCLGGGPLYAKLGAAVRYATADLDDWVARHRRQSTAAAHISPEGRQHD